METHARKIYVGTAGWSIRREDARFFPVDGSHLERYADVFNMVEINSSFYRDHRPATYRRWAESVPDDFRFCVKLSRWFTHDMRMSETGARLEENIAGLLELGEKAGALLVQLPPSLQLEPENAARFFSEIRRLWPFALACEPRHVSWSSATAREIFDASDVAKVIADPERCALEQPSFASAYFRLHGSPQIYKSEYEPPALESWSRQVLERSSGETPVFCVFDNTAIGFAVPNALSMKALVEGSHRTDELSPKITPANRPSGRSLPPKPRESSPKPYR